MPSFYEFFAGAGMAREGLGKRWNCLFANEFDVKKTAIYKKNWPTPDVLEVGDVGKLEGSDLPGHADLAWASFPCQDLSLAGAGAGLNGGRSGTFWPFWLLMKALIGEGRAPKIIVLENVCGTLTSHEGKDFVAICSTYASAGYRFGALIVDAVHFVPHSRPRLFMVGLRDDMSLPEGLAVAGPARLSPWHPRGLLNAFDNLSPKVKEKMDLVASAEPGEARYRPQRFYRRQPDRGRVEHGERNGQASADDEPDQSAEAGRGPGLPPPHGRNRIQTHAHRRRWPQGATRGDFVP